MSEQEFKDRFIAAFLAAWVAQHYDMACARSEHRKLEQPPAEDAIFLADCAWDELRKHR